MIFSIQSRLRHLRNFLSMGGSECRRPMIWIISLAVFSAIAFGAAPIFLSQWVSLLAESAHNRLWLTNFLFYLLAYGLAFCSRDVQWLLYTRIQSAVFVAVTNNLTARAVYTDNSSHGVGLLTQTLQGAQSLLFCSLFILLPSLLETVSMLTAIIGMAQFWMAIPLLLHTAGFLFLIDFGTRRAAYHQSLLSPLTARLYDLVGTLLGEKSLLQRYAQMNLAEQVLDIPIKQSERERIRMGWTRTWTTTLLNVWTLFGLAANLIMALWFFSQGKMTVGQVVAVESVFFLILRRLEMWNRGYRETGQAIEMFRPGLNLLRTAIPNDFPQPVKDELQNGQLNVLYGRTGVGKSTWLHKRWQRVAGASLLPQRHEILPGTIRFNLTLGTKDHANKLTDLLQAFDLNGVLERLPKGLDTLLYPGQPLPLSGGELQRLCLCRTLLHWPGNEMLLDEPTSAQSPSEEKHLFRALKERTQGKTVWIISHRPAAITWADRLWECTGWDTIEERPNDTAA